MRNTTVLQSEGTYGGKPAWRHYFIVTDTRTVLVDMVPAIFGWNVREIKEGGAEDWPGMTSEDIVAWKLQNHDIHVVDVTEADRVLAMVKSKGFAL